MVGTDWVLGDKTRLINVVLEGLEGVIEIKGESYSGLMLQHSFLKDHDIADVLTYIRTSFGNNASPVELEEVETARRNM